jgi:PAS domain S-box-containing protein
VIELQGVGRDITERKQMEQALHESEARYRATFDSAAIGVAIVDLAGRPLEVNEYVCRMVGYTEDELCTLSLSDFTHPDDVAENEGLLRRARDGEISSYQFEKRYLHKDGHVVWARVSASLVRGQDGTPAYVVVHLEDITPRKRLEQERAEQAEQLDRIFEGIADGLIVYNREGQLVRLNAAARRILSLDAAPSEYTQLPVRDRLSLYKARDEQGRPLAHEEWPVVRVLRGQVSGADARELRLRALDGREVECNLSAAPLHDREGDLTGAVAVLHDQTEYKRLAEEREEARASELAAEEVAQQLNAFLAMAAHDIRTPVTVISSQVQLALRRAQRLAAGHTADERPTQTPGDVAESLGIAWTGVQRLRRLVEHLFDVAQAQTGTLIVKPAPCDLAALVRGHVATQQETVQERHIVLKVPAEVVPVQADADRLDQVLGNYLSNALKYSPDDQPVTVQLGVVENQAVVSVTDRGPGLPEEEQSRIWELFHRVPGIEVQSWSGESSGSLGLGLHICKLLIELHPGGRVGVDTQVGQGSTFWFRLPLTS